MKLSNDSAPALDYRASDHRFVIGMLDVQPAFIELVRIDFAYCLDAPPSMPAGGCERVEMDMEVEIYAGAVQLFAERDPA